ncbi:choice-of-anchor M domain-containing protein [Leucobacter weissii]|uniref:Choice-of-anchor M domain-containing protein n=1 Tax=Leucobacter weissii TaxID=1983706 RepID=A0A939MLH9_9MICO|nr:choice-of-anchor M domain-containing protein [Leucobacter weissii]MBO1902963.1 choice-of-anchor M domain-containing protein [Leucobacter weissii]
MNDTHRAASRRRIPRLLAAIGALCIAIGPVGGASPALADAPDPVALETTSEIGAAGTASEESVAETGNEDGGGEAEPAPDAGADPASAEPAPAPEPEELDPRPAEPVADDAEAVAPETDGARAAAESQTQSQPGPERARAAQSQKTSAAASALPGQSRLPAPSSQTRRAIANVHTDTVSVYLDGGKLNLQSKADVDGVIGKRFATQGLVFHLSDAGRTTVPSGSAYRFLGAAGDELWLAPQIQNPRVIWPGFSTEDPNLRGRAKGDAVRIRLVKAEGPGKVELFLTELGDVRRTFSSSSSLSAWSTGVPQHTHMNWAFTAPGIYRLTFEAEATVTTSSGKNPKKQTAENTYTFAVGGLDLPTATSFEADDVTPEAGDPVTLTASVRQAGAALPDDVGAVQFRDASRNVVLGHAPVVDGTAALRTSALPSGQRRIVAEFVPAISNTHRASASEELPILVGGDAAPRPAADDARAPATSALDAVVAGSGVRILTAAKTLVAGETATAQLRGAPSRGDWVSVWLHAQSTSSRKWLGWVHTDLDGSFTVPIAKGTATGTYRLALKDRDGALLGWDRLIVGSPSSAGTVPKSPSTGKKKPSKKSAKKAGSKPGRTTTTTVVTRGSRSYTRVCTPPAVTLDRGHVDAFNVSAANGRAVLQVKEDVTGSQVIREAESVLLKVKEAAYNPRIPAGVPGSPSGYVLPLTQDQSLLWPGWDTNRTTISGYSDVSIHVRSVDGPAKVYIYTQESFGGWKPLLTNKSFTLPGTLRERTPAHTHAQWVFPKKGIYTLTVNAVAKNPKNGKSLTTATHTYVFQVGDAPLGDTFCTIVPTAAAEGAEVNRAERRATAAAISAEQAENRKRAREQAESGTALPAGPSDPFGSGPGGGAAPLEALLRGEAGPELVAGIVGGGLLVLGGIAGVTVWWVRRLGAGPPTVGSMA